MSHISRSSLGLLVAAFMLTALPSPLLADDESQKPATKPAAKVDLPSPLTWPAGRVLFAESDAEKHVRAALEKPAEFEFLDTPLGEAAEWLAKKHGIAIALDNEALAADGKGADLPLTSRGRFDSLSNGLNYLLDGQGLTLLVKYDVLLITTETAASQPENLSTRLYQVHDLVVKPNDPTASQPDFDSLIELVESTVRQQDWADNGGSLGHIRAYNGPGILALIITHEERGHRETEQLFKLLRESQLQPIADGQALQPLAPRQPMNMHGAMSIFGPMIQQPDTAPPTAAPAAASPVKPLIPRRGGGFF